MAAIAAATPSMLRPSVSPLTREAPNIGQLSLLRNPNSSFHRILNRASSSSLETASSAVDDFNPKIPIEEALTPPSSWYTEPSFLELELDRVFYRGWQAIEPPFTFLTPCSANSSPGFCSSIVIEFWVVPIVHFNGYIDQIKSPHDFFTGRLGKVEFVVCRDDNGKIHAFHNVCRHHASIIASGTGKKSCFVCPYHGWTYGLNGALVRATRIKGIRNFDVNEFGLVPIKVATWGPFVLINLEKDITDPDEDTLVVADEWLGSSSDTMTKHSVADPSLAYLCRREYIIECNWKVFCDNYLDGGYHVPYAHKGLASNLKLDSYSTSIYEKVSIQWCDGGSADNYDRLGEKALYAFVYPNFMINRYGPWMDTNLVLPLGPRKCKVVFDYFLEAHLKGDKEFVERSLKDSERVQMEDVMLCEGVQIGLESPAYSSGRYAPSVENAMHHFHRLLHRGLER